MYQNYHPGDFYNSPITKSMVKKKSFRESRGIHPVGIHLLSDRRWRNNDDMCNSYWEFHFISFNQQLTNNTQKSLFRLLKQRNISTDYLQATIFVNSSGFFLLSVIKI